MSWQGAHLKAGVILSLFTWFSMLAWRFSKAFSKERTFLKVPGFKIFVFLDLFSCLVAPLQLARTSFVVQHISGLDAGMKGQEIVLISSCVISFHMLCGLRAPARRHRTWCQRRCFASIITHKFSMGLRSQLLAGHSTVRNVLFLEELLSECCSVVTCAVVHEHVQRCVRPWEQGAPSRFRRTALHSPMCCSWSPRLRCRTRSHPRTYSLCACHHDNFDFLYYSF